MSIKELLKYGFIYRCFTKAIGGMDVRRYWIEKYVKPWNGANVLDIGCGTADLLEYMPECKYVGFDHSHRYIEVAKNRWKDRGVFIQRDVESEFEECYTENFDITMAFSVIHHLNNEQAGHLFRTAYKSLKSGGHFVTLDGCIREAMSPIAEYLIKNDRGKFVRTENEYLQLVKEKFCKISVSNDYGPLRLPYSAVIFDCTK